MIISVDPIVTMSGSAHLPWCVAYIHKGSKG